MAVQFWYIPQRAACLGNLLGRCRYEGSPPRVRRCALDSKLGKPGVKPNRHRVRTVAVRGLAVDHWTVRPRPLTADSQKARKRVPEVAMERDRPPTTLAL